MTQRDLSGGHPLGHALDRSHRQAAVHHRRWWTDQDSR